MSYTLRIELRTPRAIALFVIIALLLGGLAAARVSRDFLLSYEGKVLRTGVGWGFYHDYYAEIEGDDGHRFKRRIPSMAFFKCGVGNRIRRDFGIFEWPRCEAKPPAPSGQP